MAMLKGMSARARRAMPLRDRLNDFIVVAPDGCWIWCGTTTRNGYGQITVNRKGRVAHRVVYEEYVGPIPEGYQLDHLCRETRCVNWRHLEPVTAMENLRRSPNTSAGMTHCKRGHELSAANAIVNSASTNKVRLCRACHYARARKRRALRKVATP